MNTFISQHDHRIFLSLRFLIRSPLVSSIAKTLSMSGDGWFYVMIMPIAIWHFKPALMPELAVIICSGFSLERILYFFLKKTFKRLRPSEALDDFEAVIVPSDRFSMPSGHTSAAFLAVTFLVFGVSLSFLPLYLWALGIGISRMLLGVHFPTDIIAGAILGSSIAFLVLSMKDVLTHALYFP